MWAETRDVLEGSFQGRPRARRAGRTRQRSRSGACPGPRSGPDATFAEFESDLIKMRTREGIKIARAKGKLRGKQPKLSDR